MGVNNVTGSVFSNGNISVFVPDGWQHFSGADSEGRETPDKLLVYKNVISPLDIFCKAGITVWVTRKDKIYISPRFFYSDTKDIEPFKLGAYTWSGYTCKSLGFPYLMLESQAEVGVLQVMILLENGENKINFEDADVQAIIKSIDVQ